MIKFFVGFSLLFFVSCVTPGYYGSFAQGFNQGLTGNMYQPNNYVKPVTCYSNTIPYSGMVTTNCY
jgi:hypothetical protein